MHAKRKSDGWSSRNREKWIGDASVRLITFSRKSLFFIAEYYHLLPETGAFLRRNNPGGIDFFLTTSKPNLTSKIFWFTLITEKTVYALVLMAFSYENPNRLIEFYLFTKIIRYATGLSWLNGVNELFRLALTKKTFYLKSFLTLDFFFFLLLLKSFFLFILISTKCVASNCVRRPYIFDKK